MISGVKKVKYNHGEPSNKLIVRLGKIHISPAVVFASVSVSNMYIGCRGRWKEKKKTNNKNNVHNYFLAINISGSFYTHIYI